MTTQHPALTDPEYNTPGKSQGLFSVFKDPYLMTLLVRKGIRTRYYGSALGWIWSYVRPFAQFLMYWMVFGLLLKINRGMELFPVYLFSGLIVINLFSELFRNTTSAIVDNKSLVKKIYLPRELFPVAASGIAFIHFLPQAVILLVVSLVFGWTFSFAQLGAFMFALLIMLLWTLGLGLFFGALNVALRDAKNVVDLILMFATWASPVIYSWTMARDALPTWLLNLYMSNPVTACVELFHFAFWAPLTDSAQTPPNLWEYACLALGISILTLFIGQAVFKKLEGSFAQSL